MSGLKNLAKGGWHPGGKGEGGRESWKGDFKGVNTVAGWKNKAMGKSSDPAEDPHAHVSAPLSTLKDPSLFPPPPKHRAYHGDAASPARPRATRAEEEARQRQEEVEEEEARQPAFRPGQTPPPAVAHATKPKAKPGLPPRLPPRQNSNPNEYAPAPPPTYNESLQDNTAAGGYLNQGAMSRLGQAGVAVPGFEMGRNASPTVPPRQTWSPTPLSPPPPPARKSSQLSELQSRFASTNTPSSSSPAAPPASGTTWAEKQAALTTANKLHKDPSQVSFSDARTAASTANNFHERHGDQVAAARTKASAFNQKYNISGRMSSLASGSKASPPPPPSTGGPGKKLAPPPPPPKKKELGGTAEPPPVPLGSKPKF
ncbi:hypothetical protein PMIN02_004907 [Paraphaeosphaeria minitans]